MTKSAELPTPSGSSETQQRRRQITSYKNTTTSPATDTDPGNRQPLGMLLEECAQFLPYGLKMPVRGPGLARGRDDISLHFIGNDMLCVACHADMALVRLEEFEA